MEANGPRGGDIFYPRGRIGRIYVKLHIILLHTKHRSFGSCGFLVDFFSCISYYKPKTDNDASGV